MSKVPQENCRTGF